MYILLLFAQNGGSRFIAIKDHNQFIASAQTSSVSGYVAVLSYRTFEVILMFGSGLKWL